MVGTTSTRTITRVWIPDSCYLLLNRGLFAEFIAQTYWKRFKHLVIVGYDERYTYYTATACADLIRPAATLMVWKESRAIDTTDHVTRWTSEEAKIEIAHDLNITIK